MKYKIGDIYKNNLYGYKVSIESVVTEHNTALVELLEDFRAFKKGYRRSFTLEDLVSRFTFVSQTNTIPAKPKYKVGDKVKVACYSSSLFGHSGSVIEDEDEHGFVKVNIVDKNNTGTQGLYILYKEDLEYYSKTPRTATEAVMNTSDSDWKQPISESASSCFHVWKHYMGLMDSFDYCEKCNVKKQG